jgi:hypothetical protein
VPVRKNSCRFLNSDVRQTITGRGGKNGVSWRRNE